MGNPSFPGMLRKELQELEGILNQNPLTGKNNAGSFLDKYTNNLFGAPYQLLDSVDTRFSQVNQHLGNEYLRNIMLNSPILRVKPGMPKYTGSDDPKSLVRQIQNIYAADSRVESLLLGLAESTLFGKGAKLQRRMFGFRETYYDYMQHVNYMCRSVAVFMRLTNPIDQNSRYPNGTFYATSNTMHNFKEFKWENYRMIKGQETLTPFAYLKELVGDTAVGQFLGAFGGGGVSSMLKLLNPLTQVDAMIGAGEATIQGIQNVIDGWDKTLKGTFKDKVCAVEFMVDPIAVTETLENRTKTSALESMIDSARESFGSELGFITNSHADAGFVSDMGNLMGNGLENLATSISGMVEPLTGGFISGLFTGAVQSIKGQKMIYPEIYESSNSEQNFSFTISLSSPYGDPYNYYMNIVVPLMHLIALAAPRMVTANTVGSPYIVQAYIPGLCTVQMGIVTNLEITKNPDSNRVSVNGYPLDVKVTLTINDLYNAMSISPGNDPASFLFNETLNDYMANLAGLVPSIDTYNAQREAAFDNLSNYLGGEWMNDIAELAVEKVEDMFNPFIAR